MIGIIKTLIICGTIVWFAYIMRESEQGGK